MEMVPNDNTASMMEIIISMMSDKQLMEQSCALGTLILVYRGFLFNASQVFH